MSKKYVMEEHIEQHIDEEAFQENADIMCCGIAEYHGVDALKDFEWLACASHIQHVTGGHCALFSSVSVKKKADALADMIFENSWGQITEAVTSRNGNSGNTVRAFLWSWNETERKRLAKWVKDNIEMPEEPECHSHRAYSSWLIRANYY